MLKYTSKLYGIIIIKIVAAVISIIGFAFRPFILMLLFDYGFSSGLSMIAFFIACYFLCIVVEMGFEYISQLYGWKIEQKFNLLVRKDLFRVISNKSYQDFSNENHGYYLSLFNNDVGAFAKHLDSITSIIQTVLQLVIYGIFLFVLDFRIALIIILSSLIVLWIPKLTGKKLADKKAAHLDFLGKYTNTLKDLLTGFRTINSLSRININRHHKVSLVQSEQKLYEYGKFKTFSNVLSGSSMYLLEFIVLASIATLIFLSRITVGVAIASLNYIQSFIFPFSFMLREINNYNATKAAKIKIFDVINQDISANTEIASISKFESEIKLSNVTVSYKDFGIKNFSYSFEKGKKYAIVGHSGSGKTTLINAILQHDKNYLGTVEIDGNNIKDINVDLIFANINQSEHIFDTDFSNNASLFGTFSEDDIQRSMSFINSEILFDISSKEDCLSLSGGEKQLLLAVRMLSKNAPILVLDEAFSALDKNNRIQIERLILTQSEKTVIYITHDLNDENIDLFDDIISLDSLN